MSYIDSQKADKAYDAAAIMSRAWAIFHQHGKGHPHPMKSLGRKYFGYCLHTAWVEAKNAAQVASMPVKERKSRIASLRDAERNLVYMPAHMSIQTRRADIRAQIARLEGGAL